MIAQDKDGDTGLHLAVLHSQQEALKSLTQVVSALPGEEVLNMRNHLYQATRKPLHRRRCEWRQIEHEATFSGGTVRDLLAGLRSVGESRALSVLEEALCCHDDEMSGEQTLTSWLLSSHVTCQLFGSCHHDNGGDHSAVSLSAGEALCAQVQDLKVDVRIDSGVCDSGVELSTA
ncbi:hypothetical protein PAMA_017743 [Pampus argenteus]